MASFSHLARRNRKGAALACIASLFVVFTVTAFAQQSAAPLATAQNLAAQQKLISSPSASAPPARVSSANAALSKKAYEAGRKALTANDLTSAYADFAEAVTLDPRNKN